MQHKDLEHKHLLVSASFEKTPFIDTDFTESWISNLVSIIDMEILKSPVACRCEEKYNEGISAFCIITTSHICLHSWETKDPNLVQLDVYSCKNYDKKLILDEVNNFSPISLKHKFLDRSTFDENIL